MRSLLLPLLAAACLAAQPASAALHKCTTKEGKTIYTDGECADDAKKAEVTIRDSKGVDTTPKGVPATKPEDKAEGAPKAGPGDAPPKGTDAPPPPPEKDKPPRDKKNF